MVEFFKTPSPGFGHPYQEQLNQLTATSNRRLRSPGEAEQAICIFLIVTTVFCPCRFLDKDRDLSMWICSSWMHLAVNSLLQVQTVVHAGEHVGSHHWQAAAGLLLQDLCDSCNKKCGYCTSFMAGIFKNLSITYILLVEQIMSVKEQISVHEVTQKIVDKILAPMCICNVIILK